MTGKATLLKKGQQFGRLRVIRRVENDKHNKTRFLCQCICGNQATPSASQLLSGKTKSCGCYWKFKRELVHAKKFIDLEGLRVGLLKVGEMAFRRGQYIYWNCQCKCGSSAIKSGVALRSGQARSCGCLAWKIISKKARRRKRNQYGQFLPDRRLEH